MGFSGWRVDFPNYFPVFDSEISKLLGKHANGYELQPVLANLKASMNQDLDGLIDSGQLMPGQRGLRLYP